MKVVWTIAIKMRNALIGSFVVALRWHRALTAAGKAKVSLDYISRTRRAGLLSCRCFGLLVLIQYVEPGWPSRGRSDVIRSFFIVVW